MGLILLLALVGVAFICLEMILPGMILGIAGFIILIASLVLTFTTEDLYGMGTSSRLLVAALISLGALILIGVWMKYFDRTGLGRKLVLAPAIDHKLGHSDPAALLNAEGTAKTDLRPAGRATITGQKRSVDVIAEGGLIEAGTEIRVVKVEGSKVVVRKSSLPNSD